MPQKKQNLRRYIIMSSEGYLGASLTADNFKPSANMVAVAPPGGRDGSADAGARLAARKRAEAR
ncbi:hypothetical protein V1289_000409 [Bradyrhizobium sp. AZCC 2289]